MKRKHLILNYFPKIVAAYILLQTLWFKFGIGGEIALQESQMIFIQMAEMIFGNPNKEGLFRIGTGIMELIVAIGLFTKQSVYAATLGVMLMIGALLSHVFILGIVVNEDSGQLMIMAIITLICCLKVVYDEKEKLTFNK
ncbi:DoxX family protein [Reichenbachiella ulvae]|uniref:DoxX family protein n=1 Tax=Reichenbachiella ulvae TaxID=2980104 RepID=A0ABT3CR37_9BACT|nr:DoxX family protein [Reichenbachiella ulvae]MCV9386041.1 DoxX family protein [Reichenbachiella ulvae]